MFSSFFFRFTSSLAYYATSVNQGSLTGSVYLNTFIAGALEFPADIMCAVLLTMVGRRLPLSGGMVIGGIFLALSSVAMIFDGKLSPQTSE